MKLASLLLRETVTEIIKGIIISGLVVGLSTRACTEEDTAEKRTSSGEFTVCQGLLMYLIFYPLAFQI